ncbi:MAG: ATPase P [Flavobacteriales bacterium]|nr:ATPase P [Flavobacteriales bacterium]|tara:strand:- start:94360 stop:96465 length:2106 start_codon:yes stop_codon:yes gene_type:complete
MKKDSKKVQLKVEGMHCNNCANGIKLNLEKEGFTNVNVIFATGDVSCQLNQNQTEENVIEILSNLNYLVKKKVDNKKSEIFSLEKLFIISLFFTIPLLSSMFVESNHLLKNPLNQLLICIPVYIIGLNYFGKSAWNSIKSGIPNMDVLIFIGSSTAFFYSIAGWLIFFENSGYQKYLFFETSATIITLVLLGNLLEKRSIKKTTNAIKELSKIQEVIARKETNNSIIEIPFSEIQINDILIVNSGDKIPSDGIIIEGDALIDESIITGESLPVDKKINNQVIGGSIVKEGNIKVKVLKIGEDTMLSQIIELVKNAQQYKPNIQKIGDKVSAIFVPFVLLISILTFLITYLYFNISLQDAILRSIAVLVISCPCAMGLATPTAVMVGVGRAAKKGILIKGGETLEKLASIKNIVFDKTGTLTNGEFQISNFSCYDSKEEEVKNIIYNLEKNSSHPIAKSLCKIFKNYHKNLDLKDIKETKGLGISANINGINYKIGSSKMINSKKENDLFLLKDDKLIATLDIKDKLKPKTEQLLDSLDKEGYSLFLLSGDKKSKCDALKESINFKNVFSEQLPKDKLDKITKLSSNNATAMIGDGINDAPALSKANIGISLANATEIAMQSADVILLNNKNLTQLNESLLISKHTLITIKQNLFWAFSYNFIAIPIAIAGLLNPMWAALFMAFSDIVVIGNSIRLRHKKIF